MCKSTRQRPRPIAGHPGEANHPGENIRVRRRVRAENVRPTFLVGGNLNEARREAPIRTGGATSGRRIHLRRSHVTRSRLKQNLRRSRKMHAGHDRRGRWSAIRRFDRRNVELPDRWGKGWLETARIKAERFAWDLQRRARWEGRHSSKYVRPQLERARTELHRLVGLVKDTITRDQPTKKAQKYMRGRALRALRISRYLTRRRKTGKRFENPNNLRVPVKLLVSIPHCNGRTELLNDYLSHYWTCDQRAVEDSDWRLTWRRRGVSGAVHMKDQFFLRNFEPRRPRELQDKAFRPTQRGLLHSFNSDI